jgi:hypothetical protein
MMLSRLKWQEQTVGWSTPVRKQTRGEEQIPQSVREKHAVRDDRLKRKARRPMKFARLKAAATEAKAKTG